MWVCVSVCVCMCVVAASRGYMLGTVAQAILTQFSSTWRRSEHDGHDEVWEGGKVPWRGERSMNRYHSIPYFRTLVSCEHKWLGMGEVKMRRKKIYKKI